MEPMFKISKYGRTVNLRNSTAFNELTRYKEENKKHSQFALGDDEFLEFEIYMSKKYREDFRVFINSFGGWDVAVKIFSKAANKPSNLINYWEKRRQENGKGNIPRPERMEESAINSA